MAQIEGIVKWFNNAKGYGFLGQNDLAADVFVHYTSIQQVTGYKSLKEGEPVTFSIEQGTQGPQAANVVRTSHPAAALAPAPPRASRAA